jgi:hypothetical protein
VSAPKPIVARAGADTPGGVALPPGSSARFSAVAGPGRYEIAVDYATPRDGEITARGVSAPLPANLDRMGNRWRVATVRHPGGRLRLRAHAAALPLGAKAQQTAVYEVSLVRLDEPRELVRLREACGRYVDWYTLGARRPALP